MLTPFPGMDPYLEATHLWLDVHNRLIFMLADDLAPRLRPRYYVSIEERTYTLQTGDLLFAGRGDVAVVRPSGSEGMLVLSHYTPTPETMTVELPLADEVRETFLEVRSATNHQLVTVLEILSPTNKRQKEGRRQYLRKRTRVLNSLTHLVEIDLLCGSLPLPMNPFIEAGFYHILISREEKRPLADLLLFTVCQPIPSFNLPLLLDDQEPVVDLNTLLHTLYDRAGYDLRIDYSQPPEPPLSAEDMQWANTLLEDGD